MASSLLALPGVVFVGEDDRARLIAHLGPAAGWMIPKGVLGWSTEVSVVARGTLSEQVRRDAKIVLPEEQIPPAKLPLTHEAALKSPLVAVSSKLTQRLVDAGIRVHTVGADRVTSSFYYIAEGGAEPAIRVEGDLVAAVGAMLGDRADNAAIERVLDGLVDRLLRSLSKDRVTELSLELAAALPRAAADGTGTQDVDLDSFEKELSSLVARSEKYSSYLEEIASKLSGSNERRVDIPLFGDARKVSQGPFELTVGGQQVALVTHERWLATGPFAEPKPAGAVAPAATAPAQKSPAPAPVSQRTPAPISQRSPAPISQRTPPSPAAVQKSPAPSPVQKSPAPAPATRKPAVPAVTVSPTPAPARPFVAPLSPPRPGSSPPPSAKETAPVSSGSSDRVSEQPKPKVGTPAAEASKVEALAEEALAETPKAEAPAAEAPKAEPSKAEPAVTEAKAESTSPVPAAKPAEEAAPAPEKAAAKASDASTKPSVVEEKKAEPKPKKAKTPARDEPASPTVDEDSAKKSPEKKGGFPWLWILVLLAAAFGGYRLWLLGR